MANLPPTPAPSTDIAGKPTALSAQLDAISLPPAAMRTGRASVSSSSTNDATSDSSYRPMSPSSPEARLKAQLEKPQSGSTGGGGASRRRWSDRGDDAADSYALPPPPTRSRKIIQMKPQSGKGKGEGSQQTSPAILANSPSKGPAAPPSQQAQGHGQGQTVGGGKKKQGNTSTAAGRKIARKTAHSLIERRRRSKMNEEFGVLKDMIPACTGQEMHKLAILQASIDYMRYLETCVSELKAAHKNCKTADGRSGETSTTRNPPSYTASTARTSPADLDEDDYEDEEMADDNGDVGDDEPTAVASALNTTLEHSLDRRYTNSSTAGHSRPSVSPAILPSATTSPLFTRPSASTNQSFSNLPSPAFYAQQQHQQGRLPSLSLTSPVLQAQRSSGPPFAGGGGGAVETRQLPPLASAAGQGQGQQSLPTASFAENDEATASALLMLTADKRSWTGRGLSVKDLLSSQ